MRTSLPAIAVAGLALCTPAAAVAEIHEYEIRRLLYLQSSCHTVGLNAIESPPTLRRFRAECANASAFPEGAEVTCTDVNDDRSCRIDTKAHEFMDLELLKPEAGAHRGPMPTPDR